MFPATPHRDWLALPYLTRFQQYAVRVIAEPKCSPLIIVDYESSDNAAVADFDADNQ